MAYSIQSIGATVVVKGEVDTSPYTMRVKKHDGEIEEICLARKIGKESWSLPRAMVPLTQPDKRLLRSYPKSDIVSSLTFKTDKMDADRLKQQTSMIKQFVENMHQTSPLGGILCAKTGTGKSIMGMMMMRMFKHKTLIIVPLISLVTQWHKALMQYTDIKESDIGIVGGGIFSPKDVTIAMLHTLSKDKPEHKQLFSMFGTVIYDEVHRIATKHFSVTAEMFDCRYRIGLSATPRRKDGTDKVFFGHIGPILNRANTVAMPTVVYPVLFHHVDGSTSGCVWGGKLNIGRYMSKIAKSIPRNKMLVKIILNMYSKGRNILMLCDRVEHVSLLREMVVAKGVPRKDVGIYTGTVKEKDGKKIIIATHGSCGLGVDIPQLDTLIFASPRTDIEQPVGRILRVVEGKQTPYIIDIIDTASSIMNQWYSKRVRFYTSINSSFKGTVSV